MSLDVGVEIAGLVHSNLLCLGLLGVTSCRLRCLLLLDLPGRCDLWRSHQLLRGCWGLSFYLLERALFYERQDFATFRLLLAAARILPLVVIHRVGAPTLVLLCEEIQLSCLSISRTDYGRVDEVEVRVGLAVCGVDLAIGLTNFLCA